MAVQGILSKDLIPKVHDVWSNQRASEDKVLQNTSCMATFQSWVPCTSRHCCPQYCLPSIWTAWLASLAPYIACRVKSHRAMETCPFEVLFTKIHVCGPPKHILLPQTASSPFLRSLPTVSEVHLPEGRVCCGHML